MIINLKDIGLSFDFEHCFDQSGADTGPLLKPLEISGLGNINNVSMNELMAIKDGKPLEHNEKALFLDLPHQDSHIIKEIKKRALHIRNSFKYVISFGIGGSYLGNIALFEALKGLYYNNNRNNFPKVYFLGNNLDPQTIDEILALIDIKELHIIIISKSGSTIEPLAGFSVFHEMMKKAKLDLSNHLTIITGKQDSILHQFGINNKVHTMPMPDHIGGRFSVLSNVGLLSSAIAGIDIDSILNGARNCLSHFLNMDANYNPALLYANIGHLFYRKNMPINVLMPYSDRLESFAKWYIQLFSESLGKQQKGRTPMYAIGTTDMHSQTQQHQEGTKDKLITFIEIEKFDNDNTIPPLPGPLNIYRGTFSSLMHIALQSNQKALHSDGRPSCKITLKHLSEKTIGSLIMFFEISTVIEGLMMGINPFDQPGVEHYKKIMKKLIRD